jgi:hypothetical protein
MWLTHTRFLIYGSPTIPDLWLTHTIPVCELTHTIPDGYVAPYTIPDLCGSPHSS